MRNRLKLFERILLHISDRIHNNRMFQAIKQGLVMTIPIIMIGSFALVFAYLPITPYQNFIQNRFGGAIFRFFTSMNSATFGVLSLLMVATISFSYANMLSNNKSYTISLPVISVTGYMILLGVNEEGFNLSYFGHAGMFTAVIATVIVCALFYFLNKSNLYKKLFNKSGMDTILIGSIKGIIPGVIIVVLLLVIRMIFVKTLNVNNLQELFSQLAKRLFEGMGNNLGTAVLFVFLVQIMWFVGIHGNNVLDDVSRDIFEKSIDTNKALVAAGEKATQIISKSFIDVFVIIGGSGMILCLVIAVMLFVKRKRTKSLVKYGVLPVVFNISEIITFGLPIVYNPLLIIPFILVPIASLVISYVATYLHLVPVVINTVEWTTPVLISGYKATNSIRGSILQLVTVIVGVLIYRPFVMVYAENKELQLKKKINELKSEMQLLEEKHESTNFLSRGDELSGVARMLADDLEEDIINNKLFVVYQPQIDKDNRCIGAEALIRWKHPVGDYIYPPLIIAIAKEADVLNLLEKHLVDTVCSDLKYLSENVSKKLKISLNITTESLKYDGFEDMIDEAVEKNAIDRSKLWFEITEQDAIMARDNTKDKLNELKEKGHKLLIDDFGMGHTSLIYLQTNLFDYVKLDGSITRNILVNERNCGIISSIIGLSDTLGFNIIAEYVETDAQRDKLMELGCMIYQGYLYSQPVKFDRLVEVIEQYEH